MKKIYMDIQEKLYYMIPEKWDSIFLYASIFEGIQNLETGEISDSLGRGRHTTRAVSLYDVHSGKIADTPGFSSLDYEVANAEDLSEAFPEIRQASHGCKFRSCTHTHEPSCAVKDEVENGQIWEVRYDNYLQFLSEIENRREIYKKTIKRK